MGYGTVIAYEGQVLPDGTHQVVRTHAGGETSPLDPRLDLLDKSPSGLAWGYRGSGAAQLAFAILMDHLQDEERALGLFQDFKERVVATCDQAAGWRLSAADVDAELAALGSGQHAEGAAGPAAPRRVPPASAGGQRTERVVALADKRRALPDEEADAALRRLLKVARGDTGHAKYCANLLLSWWNAQSCGGWDPIDLWAVSPSVGQDMLCLLAFIRSHHDYPPRYGLRADFEELLRRWRPHLLDPAG